MGNCSYCGQPAGFLRSQHDDCRKQHDEAVKKIPEFFQKALGSPIDPARFRSLAEDVARTSYVNEAELRQLTIQGVGGMIDAAFNDQRLTEEENTRIVGFCNEFNITANDLGAAGTKLKKAEIIRHLDDGKTPSGITIKDLPINLARGESVIWLFNNSTYYTLRSRTKYVGSSQGFSIRLMKGVYYRTGSYRGEPLKTQHMSEEGTGVFVIASQNIYFWSPKKVAKIAPKKIVSVQPYSDGIQIMRDATNAVPQVFKLDDPAFAVDVIARLNQL